MDPFTDFGSIGFGQEGSNPLGDVDDPKGPCCFGTYCEQKTEENCQNEGGIYMGDFVGCLPDPCPQPIETSWSGLKQAYR